MEKPEHSQHTEEDLEKDPVWDLLLHAQPNERPTPWFAARTAAIARATPQAGASRMIALLTRWILPVPLAVTACLFFLSTHRSPDRESPNSRTAPASLSEEVFEQHMDLLAGNDQNPDIDTLLQSPLGR